MTPASSGPKTRARLNWIELSAIAFGQILLLHERRNERLVRRAAEGLAEPRDEREQQDRGDVHLAEVHQRRQRERRCHLYELRSDQHAAAVVAIGDDAADEREQEDRELPEEVVEAQVERGIGQLEDEPRLGHLLHPVPDRRGESPEPQDAEIAVVERGEGPADDGVQGFGRRLVVDWLLCG